MGCGSTAAVPLPLPFVVFVEPSVTAVAAEVRRWCSWVHEILCFVKSFWMALNCLSSGVWSST
eukprot:3465528-Pyramimonas_sp.AAC.1